MEICRVGTSIFFLGHVPTLRPWQFTRNPDFYQSAGLSCKNVTHASVYTKSNSTCFFIKSVGEKYLQLNHTSGSCVKPLGQVVLGSQ